MQFHRVGHRFIRDILLVLAIVQHNLEELVMSVSGGGSSDGRYSLVKRNLLNSNPYQTLSAYVI